MRISRWGGWIGLAGMLVVAPAQAAETWALLVGAEINCVIEHAAPHGKAPGQKVSPETQKNRAVTDVYEPGSVFKVVTVAGALSEGLVTPRTKAVVVVHYAGAPVDMDAIRSLASR